MSGKNDIVSPFALFGSFCSIPLYARSRGLDSLGGEERTEGRKGREEKERHEGGRHTPVCLLPCRNTKLRNAVVELTRCGLYRPKDHRVSV